LVFGECRQRLGLVSHHRKRVCTDHEPSGISNAHAVHDIVRKLHRATQERVHEFWAHDVSILDDRLIDTTRIHGPRQLTDVYLLALAVRHGGVLVTFDRAIAIEAVRGATASLVVL